MNHDDRPSRFIDRMDYGQTTTHKLKKVWKPVTIYRAYFETPFSATLDKTLSGYIPGYTLIRYVSNEGIPGTIVEYISSMDDQAKVEEAVDQLCVVIGQTCAMLTITQGQTQCTCD